MNCRRKPKNLPRGLTQEGGQYRIRFQSRHTKPGKIYRERLPEGIIRRDAETYLAKLREADRLEELKWPLEKRLELESQKSWTFGEFCKDRYLDWCRSNNRESTVKRKEQELTTISPWFWDCLLTEIDEAKMEQFKIERRAEGVRARTVNIGINQVHHVLTIAYKMKCIPEPPPTFRNIRENDKRPSRALTHEQAEQILRYASEKKEQVWHTLVTFLLHTGVRYSEARELCWHDLDFSQNLVTLEGHKTKNGKQRTIPLIDELVEVLQSLPRREGIDFVFTIETWSRKKGKRERRIQQLPNFSGSGRKKYPWEPPKLEPPLRVSPHVFRHTFATWRILAGVSLTVVQAWLGHSSIQITSDLYGHIKPEECRDEIKKY